MAFVIGSHYCPVEIARTKSWGIWVIYVGQVRSGVACEFQFSLSLSFQALETSLDKISVSLFPSRNIFRPCPIPVCAYFARIFASWKRRIKDTRNYTYAYIYIYVDSDIDGFWMETDGSMERPTKGQHVPRLSIRECKWSARFANYAWQVIKSTV